MRGIRRLARRKIEQVNDIRTIAWVAAPTPALYEHWRKRGGKHPDEFPLIKNGGDLKGYWGPILVLNGGSSDPLIRSLVRHPTRAGNLTYLWV